MQRRDFVKLGVFASAALPLRAQTSGEMPANAPAGVDNLTEEDTQSGGYYLDSIHGADSNSGTKTAPWKTLKNLDGHTFKPGDTIHFARGSTFKGGFRISSSGTERKPITIAAYGVGPAPHFTNSNWSVLNGNAIQVDGSWIIIDGLYFSDGAAGPPAISNSHKAGAIYLTVNATHNIVRNCDISRWPFPIHVYGQHNLITHNYIHDLMSLPAEGWWAVGVVICNSNNRACYNRIVNCRQVSQAYNFDGGAFELDDRDFPKDNITIDHNISRNNQGFLEIVEGSASVKNLIIAYNVSDDYQQFLRLSSTEIWNARVENNTVVFTKASVLIPAVFDLSWFGSLGWSNPGGKALEHIAYIGGAQGSREASSILTYRNNIFVLGGNLMLSPYCDFPHDHNIYYRPHDHPIRAWAILGANAALGAGDKIADPKFVNMEQGDFHLQPDSPAIDMGVNVGFKRDVEEKPVSDTSPDAGAYEHQ